MDSNCVTISGLPSSLASFSDSLPPSVSVHKTTIQALYHSSENGAVRNEVLADITRREIRIPSFDDLKIPLWSTFTGQVLRDDGIDIPAKLVIDMILLHPVNWDRVLSAATCTIPSGDAVRLVNIGPGSGLLRYAERSFATNSVPVTLLDISSSENTLNLSQTAQQPMAIVGMAVNMPGAPSVSKLWEVLEQGLNTISEARLFLLSMMSDLSLQCSYRHRSPRTGSES